MVDGVELPSYRGDMVNAIGASEAERIPDPERLLRVYEQSSSTLNPLRAFAQGGIADLNAVNSWRSDFISDREQADRFTELSERINECLSFMKVG